MGAARGSFEAHCCSLRGPSCSCQRPRPMCHLSLIARAPPERIRAPWLGAGAFGAGGAVGAHTTTGRRDLPIQRSRQAAGTTVLMSS